MPDWAGGPVKERRRYSAILALTVAMGATLGLASNSCVKRDYNTGKSSSVFGGGRSGFASSEGRMHRLMHRLEELESQIAAQAHSQKFSAKTRSYDVDSYRVDVAFDWTRQVMTGVSEIRFTPKDPKVRRIELDCAVNVKAVTLLGGAPVPYEVNADRKTITLTLPSISNGLHPDLRDPKSALLAVRIQYEVTWPNSPGGNGINQKDGLVLSEVYNGPSFLDRRTRKSVA
jgi:hypothetical protein